MPTTISNSVSLPAVLYCEPATGGVRVASLTLMDRLLVAVHRAGAGPIFVVVSGDLPDVRRARALGVPFTTGTTAPAGRGATLVATTGLLVHAPDVLEVLRRRGKLTTVDGKDLPLAVVESTEGWGGDPRFAAQQRGDTAPVRASGVAVPICGQDGAAAAERVLWASLNSSSDGMVDKWFNRPAGRWMSKVLIHTPVSPNQISLVSIAIGLAAGGMFALGEYRGSVVAAVMFQISAIVDCVDGDVARCVFKESPFGKWLDLVGDQLVHAGVFMGVAVGLWRHGDGGQFLWLGTSAVVGGLVAFAVVVRGMKKKGEPNRRLQKLIDGATSRDFSVVVLGLACWNQLSWFLWMAAIGSHVFWILALSLQVFPGKQSDRSS